MSVYNNFISLRIISNSCCNYNFRQAVLPIELELMPEKEADLRMMMRKKLNNMMQR